MKNSRLINSITYALLALFLATKLMGVHVLSHDDHQEDYLDHCAVCHNIASDIHVPIVLDNVIEPVSEHVEFVAKNDIASVYHFQVSGTLGTSFLFSRPPPRI